MAMRMAYEDPIRIAQLTIPEESMRPWRPSKKAAIAGDSGLTS